jgi:tetratricopeptide (TPR) repeat protein
MVFRGLAALLGKLNSLLSAGQREETEALDLFGLSRYLQRRGEAAMAESACVAARGRGLPVAYDAQAQSELALMAKRRGEHAQAAEIWQELLRNGEYHSNTYEQLAIYYERREKDFKKALEFAWMGLKELRKRSGRGKFGMTQPAELRRIERLMKRVARLEQRLNTLRAADSAPLLRRARATAGGT